MDTPTLGALAASKTSAFKTEVLDTARRGRKFLALDKHSNLRWFESRKFTFTKEVQ